LRRPALVPPVHGQLLAGFNRAMRTARHAGDDIGFAGLVLHFDEFPAMLGTERTGQKVHVESVSLHANVRAAAWQPARFLLRWSAQRTPQMETNDASVLR